MFHASAVIPAERLDQTGSYILICMYFCTMFGILAPLELSSCFLVLVIFRMWMEREGVG